MLKKVIYLFLMSLLCISTMYNCSGKKKGNNLGMLLFAFSSSGSSASNGTTNSESPTEVTIETGPTGSVAAGVSFSKTSLLISESGLIDSVGIALKSKPTANVSLNQILVSGDPHVILSRSSLQFNSDNWDQVQFINISTSENQIATGNRSFQLTINSVISSDTSYQGLTIPPLQGTTIDNDVAGITLSSANNIIVSESGTNHLFQIQLNSQPTHSVTIQLNSSNTSEGTVSSSSVTFSSSDWNVPKNITVTGVNDSIQDGNQNFNIQFPVVSSLDSTYNNYMLSPISATNSDNDTASIVINQLNTKTTESGGEAGVTVKLGSQPTGDVSINIQITAGDTDEAILSNSVLLFNATNWNTIQNLKLTGVDDPSVDGNRVYQVTFSPSSASDIVYNTSVPPSNLSFTNDDNDSAGFQISPNGGLVTSESGDTAIFNVRLLSKPNSNVTIPIYSSDITEGSIQGAITSLTFTPTNWSTNQSVTVIGLDDNELDRNQNYLIVLDTAVSSDSHYNGMNPNDVSVTNSDNDTAGFTVLATLPFTVSETVSGTNQIFIRLNKMPTDSVRIPNITTSNSTLATANVSELNFSTSNWNVWQEITIQGIDNQVDELSAGQSFTISFGNSQSSDSAYSGVALNSIAASLLDNDTSSFTVTISNLYRNASYTDSETLSLLVSDDSLFTSSITIRGTSRPSTNVIVPVSTANSTLTLSKPSFQLTSSNWNTGDRVNITGVTDTFTGETFDSFVQVGSASGKSIPNGTPYDSAVIRFNNVIANVYVQTCESTGRIYTCARRSTLFQNVPPIIRTGEKNTTAGIYFIAMKDEPSVNVNVLATVSNDSEVRISSVRGGSGTTFTKSADNKRNISANLIFRKTDYRTLRSISLLGVDETEMGLTNEIDGNKPYQISHTVSSADLTFHGMVLSPRNGTNVDNDTTFLVLNPANSSSARYFLTRTAGPSRTFTFNVSLSVPPKPGKSVTFPLSLTPSGQATLNKTSLVFDSSNWNVPQSVTATATIGSSLTSTNYSMRMSPLVSDDPAFTGKTVSDVFLTNTYPRIIISKTNVSVSEWGELQPSVTGGRTTFTVSLSAPIPETVPATNLQIGIVSSDPNEVMTSPSVLTFTSANWRTAQTVTVIGKDDSINDGNKLGTISFTKNVIGDPTYDAFMIPGINFTNMDDDNY